MLLKKWDDLPEELRTEEVKKYYDGLKKKQVGLFFKRVFDIVISLFLLIILLPVFLILAIAIKIDSKGPVFYRQVRVTQYNREFRIHKFRSMVQDADKGSHVTVGNDCRVTRVGRVIRACRLDEICQLLDVLCGNMTFVGTRPEVPEYTAQYTPAMMATLLLPAGITSLASVYYKDEAALLEGAEDPHQMYINKILPEKMYFNLKGIAEFSFWGDIRIMIMTFLAVCGKEYQHEHIAEEEDSREYAER